MAVHFDWSPFIRELRAWAGSTSARRTGSGGPHAHVAEQADTHLRDFLGPVMEQHLQRDEGAAYVALTVALAMRAGVHELSAMRQRAHRSLDVETVEAWLTGALQRLMYHAARHALAEEPDEPWGHVDQAALAELEQALRAS